MAKTAANPVQPASGLRRRLGDALVAAGIVTRTQLDEMLALSVATRTRLGDLLLQRNLVSEDRLIACLATHYGVPTLTGWTPDPGGEVRDLIPARVARMYDICPVRRLGDALVLAMTDPENLEALDTVAGLTGLRIMPVLATPATIHSAIRQLYDSASALAALAGPEGQRPAVELVSPHEGREPVDLLEVRASAEQVPVVQVVNHVLTQAIEQRASDIHMEPGTTSLRIKYRIDGMLHDVMAVPKRLEPAVVSRIKIMAALDIAERRLPQDGRLRVRFSTREVDFRVSLVPTVLGESICLRLLDAASLRLDLGQLGFDPWSLQQFLAAIQAPHGMILLTGPTGSGKTTTLYSAIQRLRAPEVNILTIEDPVEYTLEGVRQIQVSEEIGRSFAAVLRAFLRHDPDVILVGEMRDLETAQISMRAALTGHLVLSTLHTNDCASTIARLLDMGVPPFVTAASVRLVMAQRLVRRLCLSCREPYEVDGTALAPYGGPPVGAGPVQLFRKRGCGACRSTGMRGRVAIYEAMPVTPELRAAITAGAALDELVRIARRAGMRTLRESGLQKAIEGVTTLDEVLRATLA